MRLFFHSKRYFQLWVELWGLEGCTHYINMMSLGYLLVCTSKGGKISINTRNRDGRPSTPFLKTTWSESMAPYLGHRLHTSTVMSSPRTKDNMKSSCCVSNHSIVERPVIGANLRSIPGSRRHLWSLPHNSVVGKLCFQLSRGESTRPLSP
jgi:hypothetical protein